MINSQVPRDFPSHGVVPRRAKSYDFLAKVTGLSDVPAPFIPFNPDKPSQGHDERVLFESLRVGLNLELPADRLKLVGAWNARVVEEAHKKLSLLGQALEIRSKTVDQVKDWYEASTEQVEGAAALSTATCAQLRAELEVRRGDTRLEIGPPRQLSDTGAGISSMPPPLAPRPPLPLAPGPRPFMLSIPTQANPVCLSAFMNGGSVPFGTAVPSMYLLPFSAPDLRAQAPILSQAPVVQPKPTSRRFCTGCKGSLRGHLRHLQHQKCIEKEKPCESCRKPYCEHAPGEPGPDCKRPRMMAI